MRPLFALVVALVAWLPAPAFADGERTRVARELYEQGRQAYERTDFQAAYDAFQKAYLISQQPELLYNISSALEGQGRLHEAAETLRVFLKRRPDDPDRAAIEKHIQQLESAASDIERIPRRPAEPRPVEPVAAKPALPVEALVAAPPPRSHRRRTGLIVGLTIAGVVVVGAAIGLGVAFGSSTKYPTPGNGAVLTY